MKWLEKLVLTKTLADDPEPFVPMDIGKMWFVLEPGGKDETGSGLSWNRPTTYEAAFRECARQKDRIYVLPRDSDALQSL